MYHAQLLSHLKTKLAISFLFVVLLIVSSLINPVQAARSDRAENNGFTAVFHADRTVSVEGTAPTHANGIIEIQFDSAPESVMLLKEKVSVDKSGYFHYRSPAFVEDQLSVFIHTNQNVIYFLGLRYADTLTTESPGEGITRLDEQDPRLQPVALDERQIADIRAKWQQYQPVFDYKQDPYNMKPQTSAPYLAGQLQEQVQNDALNATRFVRYLASLSENVQLDPQLEASAQYKTVVLQQTYKADDPHNPPQPADMNADFYEIAESWKNIGGTASENLHYGYNPADAVLSFMDDRGAKNRYNVGHRRAILQIGLQRVGFGMTERYTLMHLNTDRNLTWPNDREYIAWPSAGYFPTLLSDFEMFSITLNPSRYAPIDLETLRVEVIDQRNQVSYLFYETANFNSDAGSLYVSSNRYGGQTSEMLTFGPWTSGAYGLDIQDGDTIMIQVSGLHTTDGQPASFSYVTRFFEMDEQKQQAAQQQKIAEEAYLVEQTLQEQQLAEELLQQQTAPSFRDVSGHWAETAIVWGIDAGYVTGYSDQTFRPNATVTEAEFLAFFLRPRVELANWALADDKRWNDPLYHFAKHYDFPANGITDIQQRSQPITRVRVAELIAHFDGQRDVGDDAIGYLLEQGYSSGKTAPTIAGYEGAAYLTRAEALTFSYSLRDRLANFKVN